MEVLREFKIIWSYLKKYKKEVYKISILALVSSAISAFIPYLYGKLVDLVSDLSKTGLILNLLGIWLLMSAIGAFLSRIVGQRGSFLGVEVYSDLICQAANHLIKLPFSFHKEEKVGEVYSKIERGAHYFGRIIDEILFWALPQFLAVFIGIPILFFVEWKLAIGTILLFLGYILITIYKTTPIIETQENLNKVFEKVSGNLYDSFLNVQTIKSCAAEEFQNKKTETDYKKELSKVLKNFLALWQSLGFWQQLWFSISFVGIFAFALSLLGENLISPGKLVMFLGYLNLISLPLRNLGWQWQLFRTGMTAIKRVEKFLKIEPEKYQGGKIIKEIKGRVEFKNVGFGYRDGILVLKNINFTVKAGQKIALVGGSGEGKTTLVDLISLYFKPTQGEILIDDVNIQDLNLQFLRKITAYVPQEIILFNDTVKNNILYGKPDATNEEIIKAAKAANAHDFIESLPQKYETLVGERGIKLSAGQKQRIAIARAIISDPEILILDEATSSLDAESERLVQEALENLIKGKTTFIIAHRLSTVRKADKILVLEKGEIVEEGTHQDLIKKKGLYHKFYSLQFQPSL